MDFLEKDLEEILFESPQSEIIERGLRTFIYSNIERQYVLGRYGIADLVTVNFSSGAPFIITVYELKNKIINTDAYCQLIRYMRGVSYFLNKIGISSYKFRVKGVLVGRELDLNSELCYIPDLFQTISIFTYSYKLQGISFSEIKNFVLTNPGMAAIPTGFYQSVESTRDILKAISFSQQCANGTFFNEKSP